MLETRPQILVDIPRDAWALPLMAAAGKNANTSPLYWLASTDEGQALLELMLEKTPDILVSIAPEAWARPLEAAAGDEANTTPLYWFT